MQLKDKTWEEETFHETSNNFIYFFDLVIVFIILKHAVLPLYDNLVCLIKLFLKKYLYGKEGKGGQNMEDDWSVYHFQPDRWY